jgi:NADH-quinone oxidoreductase subunit N
MIDHIALLPVYCAAVTALVAFLVDLFVPGRWAIVVAATGSGTVLTGVACWFAARDGARQTFCMADTACSYRWNGTAALLGGLFAVATAAVLGLSIPLLRARVAPAGEYCFLLACSLTGGVVLGAAGDLITLIVALETLTLPLYVLVGLRRRSVVAAEAAVTFFIVSVVSTAVSLLGAALLYAATGALHFTALSAGLADPGLRSEPLVGVAVVLLLAGLAFKVAAVPFHAWAPSTYDGAALPVAAYLSTASKLGGVIAVLYVTVGPLRPWSDVAGAFFGVVAALTMTVGNLGALRQTRMVRLLAWSSVAQAGYLLAPLAVVSGISATAALAYTVFYVLLELGAFGAVVALRGSADGGTLEDYRGAARRHPWVAGVLVLALAGLAGLPPGLAGLFAKVGVVRALLEGGAGWLAVVLAVNAVVGLAYYVRAALSLFAAPAPGVEPHAPGGERTRVPLGVALAVAAITVAIVVAGFLPGAILSLSST